jgi:integrase
MSDAINITQKTVSGIPTPKKASFYWDRKLSGFGVSVKPSGLKTYIFQYRNASGRTKRMTLGRHENPLKAQAAREIAEFYATSVKRGEDPAEAKKVARLAPTLQEIVEEYITESPNLREEGKKDSSLEQDRRHARLYIYKYIKPTRKVREITRGEVMSMRKAMEDSPNSFNRAYAVLRAAMEYAESNGHRDQNSNPCRYVKKFKVKGRERYLTTDEFARLGEALAEAERTQTVDQFALAALRLLTFLGARRGEILNLKWEDVHFENSFLYLPDSKTGKKEVYLNAPAKELLSNLPKVKSNPYVIVGRIKGRPLVDLKGPWNRIRKDAQLEGLRIHDLRHSFASMGAKGGVPLKILSNLLGHSSIEMTERYSHLADDPVHNASDVIGNQIQAIMNPEKEDVEIIDLHA